MTYLTFKDTAKELQISYSSVTRMVADGLPVVHVRGRIYRVHREALDRYLQERTRVETPSDLNWRGGFRSTRYDAAEMELLAMQARVRKNKRGAPSRLAQLIAESRKSRSSS
jgi:excisionase family DNA binding protein